MQIFVYVPVSIILFVLTYEVYSRYNFIHSTYYTYVWKTGERNTCFTWMIPKLVP